MSQPPPRTAAATAEHQRRAVHRAVDDPVSLERAARIIRVALARKKLVLADLTPDLEPAPASARAGHIASRDGG